MRRALLFLCVFLLTKSACAFAPWIAAGAVWLTEYVGIPVCSALGCAFAYSPPIRAFGTERAVYGLDWGSLACHAGNVYGMQMSFVGGSFERSLYGLQIGILASGYAQEEVPFGDYHFCNLDFCQMNGIQFGTLAAKTATANGCQLSAIYTEARTVNGLQVGLVNTTRKLRGIQAGIYNSTERGLGLQVGLVNCTRSGLADFLPILNFVY